MKKILSLFALVLLFTQSVQAQATLPFSQNWSDTAAITTNDVWSGVPNIIGFRGDNLVASTGASPDTILANSDTIDVVANQSNPTSFTSGAVVEFDGITDPTIAINGSGTADAPYIRISITTAGKSDITVAYNLRDLDGSADNSVQPVALQYRIGTTGNFTNVPAGFIADASSGPSLNTLVTAVSAVLPADANDQAEVQIRIITANAAGNDEAIGIDDISITGTTIPVPQNNLLKLVGSYKTGIYNSGGGTTEIVAHDPATQRLFAVNGASRTMSVISISNPAAPVLLFDVVFSGQFAPNSVASKNGLIAVALQDSPKTNNGRVFFYDANGADAAAFTVPVKEITVGALPDMLTFTPDGNRVLVANEGEPNSYGQGDSFDPEGSVSIIDLTGGVAAATVVNVGFGDFNLSGGARAVETAAEITKGLRIFGPGATVAQDLEPEYIAITGDTAFVTLQENNAVAIIQISTASVISIKSFGFKNHNLAGNGLDASDRDGASSTAKLNIRNWPVFGMYLPDGVATYSVGGKNYFITANEGDAREYVGLLTGSASTEREDPRIRGNFALNSAIFTDSLTLVQDSALGRLRATKLLGNGDGANGYDSLFTFGTRSFSVWDDNGVQVYDSGDELEQRTASAYPSNFNSSNDNNTFEDRSASKGPEPEGITVGEVGGRVYAFIGLERIGGIMIYDVTTPAAPVFVQYLNNRDFAVAPGAGTALTVGDLGPEGIVFVPAAQSPNSRALVITANEVSGTVSIFVYDDQPLSVGSASDAQPQTFALKQNYPNPFNPSTTIAYTLANAEQVSLKVYDVLGREVATLVNNKQSAGNYRLPFNASRLASGVYFYRLTAGAQSTVKKMMLLK